VSNKFESKKQSLISEKPSLVTLVGESGAGKSTLCKLIDCPDIWYSSSGTIVKKLNELNIPVTHDSIHKFANKAYLDNPEWQVPNILAEMVKKRVLILDGPRRIKEVQALRKKNINMIMIRITANEEERFRRLQIRDGVDRDGFERVLRDESRETELGQLLLMSDLIIENNGSMEDIQERAKDVKKLIISLQQRK
jgi:dephospho-CoA kinase